MTSFGKTLRSHASALGFGLAAALSAVAASSIAVAPAYAQTETSMEFGKPYQEATAAYKAKSYSTALAKADEAGKHAKSVKEKLAVEQLRTGVYNAQGNKAKLVSSLEAQLAIGGLSADMVRSHKLTIAGTYAQLGQTSKALQLTKEYVNQYGGSSQQYAYLASSALAAKNTSEAISYANKAIDQSRKEGKKPSEKMFNIIMKANYDAGKMDDYYAALERAAGEYPKPAYMKGIIDRAEKAPRFDRNGLTLDVQRAYMAANIPMTDKDKREMAEQAVTRGMAAESVALFKEMFDSGKLGGASDPLAARNKGLYDRAKADAEAQKNGGLAKDEADAASQPTGLLYVQTGEKYIGMGDYAKAVELIQKGIDKGSLKPDELANAQLHLGYAQYKAGKKSDARKTWAAIKSDNGAQELGKAWTLIAK